MKNRAYGFVFLFLSLVSLFVEKNQLPAASNISSYETYEVGNIHVVFSDGSTEQKKSLIENKLKTKKGYRFSQEDFDEDLKVLAKEFDTVDPMFYVEDGKLNINLTLKAKPIIAKIIWSGNQGITTDRLQKELGVHAQEVFDRQTLNKALHKIKAYYITKGYFAVDVSYETQPADTKHDVVVHINIQEGKPGFVKEIIFEGFSDTEKAALESVLMTKEYSFWTSWLTNEGTLRQQVLEHDEMNIVNFIQNEGYLDATITTHVEEIANEERINIRFILNRGHQYFIGTVRIQGGEQIIPHDTLLQIAHVHSGDVYSPEKVRSVVRVLYDAFGSKGYVDAHVSPSQKRVGSEYVYDIDFTIQAGERFRVGVINVLGNHRTENSVILHETLLIPGEYFNTNLLQKSEERLKNIGYFKNVNVYATKSSVITQGTEHFRDVHIEVEEMPTTANFQVFVAFSTAESISGGIGLTENNFNIKGISQIFKNGLRSLRGGGEYLGINMVVGTKQLSYTLSWTRPYFLDTPWLIGVDLQKMRNSFASEDYSIKSYSAQLYGRYPINAFVKWGSHYRIKHSFINVKHHGHSRRNAQLLRESRNGGLISAVGVDLDYDSTDHPRAPTLGVRSSLSLEYAGLGGDHTFAVVRYLNNFYWSPYKKGVFRVRANVQFIKTLGSTHPQNLPLDERLYSGGETSIRGYVYNRVGPKFHDRDRTVRGGMSEVFLSAEYKQYLFSRLDGFLFFDAGNAYWKQFYLGDLRYSAGYGIKIKLAENMPLTLGMGYPLNPLHKDDVKKFFMMFESSF